MGSVPHSLVVAAWLCLMAAVPAFAGDESKELESRDELPPGVLAVPEAVRGNLGITFVKVERRVVERTLRIPGRFEAPPEARVEYRAGARGIVTPLVRQYDRVEAGTPLYRLDSSAWLSVQRELSTAKLEAEHAEAELAALRAQIVAVRESIRAWESRVQSLEELKGSGAANAAQVAEAQAQLVAQHVALTEAIERERDAEHERFQVLDNNGRNPRFEIALREAAALHGESPEWLLEETEGLPRWRSLRSVEVRARAAGVVESFGVAQGALVEDSGLVLRVLDPNAVRFRAFALQADVTRIAEDAAARIVPPMGSEATYAQRLDASLRFGTEADPEERTFDVLAIPTGSERPQWAREGMAAFLEVVLAGDEEPELAIPLSALLVDELDRVYFLRDRNDPDRVRRVVADAGVDDGRWVTILSGLRAGDEVVLHGAYELKLAGGGKPAQGGHFHADGTFHAGEH